MADGAADVITPPATDGGTLDSYGQEVAADRPVLWYRFDDAVGATTVADAAGTHHGTISGNGVAALGQPGVAGNGMTLGGARWLDVGDAFSFAGKSSFTLEAWVKTSGSDGDQRLFYKRDDGGPGGYVVYLAGDETPHFECTAGVSSWSEKAIPIDTFVHIAVVVTWRDGTAHAWLYKNGAQAEKGGFETTNAVPTTTVPLVIGDGVKGTIDEVALYDTALSEARILRHYLAGIGQ